MRTFLKSFLPAFVILTGACAKITEPSGEIISANPGNDHPATKWARVYYGATPSYSGDTKTALDGAANMFWNTGDMISLFQSSTNEQYLFSGEDGSNWSEFVKNDESVPGAAYAHTYALYPWAAGVASTTEGTLTFTLPDTQPYAIKSFAQNANPMIAVTADAVSNELKFQNLCAFLQLRIYGDATVRRIRFYGNNNEVLCGDATVTASYGSAPSLALSGEGGKVLTIDCGEGGITLGASAEAYTPVWLVVPPVSFTKGFTFEIERVSGEVSTKSTAKSVTLTRGHAQPMTPFEVEVSPKELFSFSLSAGGNEYKAFEIQDNIVSIQVPNSVDMTDMTANFTFAGESVSVGGVNQTSGVNSHDFSEFTTPIEYVVTASDASTRTYTIRMFNLPIVTIETPGRTPITDANKDIWQDGSVVSIRETSLDGKSTVTTYTAEVRGRGNSSWNQPKKPYAIKLSKKAEILGMAKHKRWVLLANTFGYFFGHPIGYEMSRRTESMSWAPHGEYVELFLNGVFLGNYRLTEQIKIDENRVNITSMSSSDIAGDAVTGGYLLTYDNTWDERYKFHSQYYNMPVMFKDPDPDPDKGEGTLPDEQMNYIQDYINTLEASLKDANRLKAREYADYIDVDTYIDQYFVWEMAGRFQSDLGYYTDFAAPRSVWFNKDRNGKLKAGPVWDFDTYMFVDQVFRCNKAQYYGELFKEPGFVARVKEKWPAYRARLDENGGMEGYLDELYSVVKYSARRDHQMWPWTSYQVPRTVDEQYDIIKAGITAKLDWLGEQIAAMKVNYDDKSGGNEDYSDQQDKGGDFGFEF